MNDLNWERFRSHLDAELAEMRAEFAEMRAELRDEFRSGQAVVRDEFRSAQGSLRIDLLASQDKLLRWMVVSFAGFFVGLAGLAISLATFLRG
ncbi:MAG TPA: hypothetical protein VM099_13540 [Gemmatimonadaceae bacterium]|nr:hypothetical protein [Gemmatimonadaceae bacterium]